MPALKPLLILYLIMANITGPTDTDRNIPSPKPATIPAIIVWKFQIPNSTALPSGSRTYSWNLGFDMLEFIYLQFLFRGNVPSLSVFHLSSPWEICSLHLPCLCNAGSQ